ncbi:MAG TPA: zinc ribbon domain-containing protein [Polyangiaceae bacterium]|nr:zinc ribbon domain-containing protein [Polyangiaceae bacterium]
MTYEYACEACGHQWEAEQSIKDAPLRQCVACGKEKAKRLVSGGTGFLLKGGGWYADLYSSAGKSAASSGDTPATKASSNGSAATKSDSGGSDAGAKSSAASESKAAKPSEAKASSAPST